MPLRTEHLRESETAEVPLSDAEANTLIATGKRLASDKTWFGQVPSEDRTVIRCTRTNVTGVWSVRVQDAVGVVSVGELQIVVRPKIPTEHLLFLFSQALQLPRLDDQRASAEAAPALWELIARWFVRSMMTVLRRDLSRDYHLVSDTLQTVRGRVSVVPTARAYYTGRIALDCEFDDFVADTPLNRMLKAAAREVSRSALLTPDVRRDALRIVARLEDVGELQHGDLFVNVDRRTWYYRDAITLARHILNNVGRTFALGSESAWTFLIRTPELVEAGVRQVLADGLPQFTITKRTGPIVGAPFGAHPDLVFGTGWAIGDVKYKNTDDGWNRPDLYEVVAFAAAFRCIDAALVYFSQMPLSPRSVSLGETTVYRVAWDCSQAPVDSCSELLSAIRRWADTVQPPDRASLSAGLSLQ